MTTPEQHLPQLLQQQYIINACMYDRSSKTDYDQTTWLIVCMVCLLCVPGVLLAWGMIILLLIISYFCQISHGTGIYDGIKACVSVCISNIFSYDRAVMCHTCYIYIIIWTYYMS